jgi:RHS repeat-associated protein
MPGFDHDPPPLNAFRQPLLRRLVCTILIVCLGLPAQIWAWDGKAGPVSPHIVVNRSAKSVQGSATKTTRYLVDTNNPTGYAQVVEEHESTAALLPAASGSLTTVYAYGHDLISQDRLTQPGTWHLSYYLYDGGGHVRALATTTATLTDSYSYDAYGILIASTGTTANHYLYRGEQFDPDLKLYYQRARYLNAETGRFWTQDTYEGSPGSPASLHKYLYANSDPVGGWDPSGHMSLPAQIATVTVIVILAIVVDTYLYWRPGKENIIRRISVSLSSDNLVGYDKDGNECFRCDIVHGPDYNKSADSDSDPDNDTKYSTRIGTFPLQDWEDNKTLAKWGAITQTPWEDSWSGYNAFGPHFVKMSNTDGQGIHGTIGLSWGTWSAAKVYSSTSHGCIRIANTHIIALRNRYLPKPRGTKVSITP